MRWSLGSLNSCNIFLGCLLNILESRLDKEGMIGILDDKRWDLTKWISK
jgi:hypothetical protein